MPDPNLPPIPETLPVVPTTNLVLFPYMMAPMNVGRPVSLAALDAALSGDRIVALAMQRDETIEQPTPDDIHTVGCAALIMRMQRMPEGPVQIIVQGLVRVRLSQFTSEDGMLRALIESLPDP